MGKFPIFNLCSCLLFFNLSISQNFKEIPDSLKEYSYEDLNNKIVKHKFNYKNNYIYPNTYLLKAKGEMKLDLFEYIEIRYNRKRKHSTLNNKTIEEFNNQKLNLKNVA
ncbi:hypothetical protein [Flavobacterium sp.]|uniref:hypothetical protein n=1 Tax=Flavobacterium sp. TaxID=239 RepID=UPI003D6C47C1